MYHHQQHNLWVESSERPCHIPNITTITSKNIHQFDLDSTWTQTGWYSNDTLKNKWAIKGGVPKLLKYLRSCLGKTNKGIKIICNRRHLTKAMEKVIINPDESIIPLENIPTLHSQNPECQRTDRNSKAYQLHRTTRSSRQVIIS